MVDEFKRADLGGYVQLEGPPDSVTHPRREMDGRLHREVFYEQLPRVIYVPFEGRVKGYNLKIEVSFL